MKLAIKLALAGSAMLAAGSAMANIAPITSSNGGELFLVVLDTSSNQAYVRGLGITEGQVMALGEGANQANSAQTGPTLEAGTAANAALNAALNIGPDSNLTAFLGTAGAKTYEIVAGWKPGTLLSDGTTVASEYISTSAKPIFNGGTYVASPVSNSTVTGSYGVIASNITGANGSIGAANPGSVALDGLSNAGNWSITGTNGPGATATNLTTWFGKGFGAASTTNGAPTVTLNSSAGLFAAATNITGNASAANLWQIGTVTLSSTGALSFTGNPGGVVPLPAAAWLLGSALFGLVGVGRRRKSV